MATALKGTMTNSMTKEKPKPELKAPGNNSGSLGLSDAGMDAFRAVFNIGTMVPPTDPGALWSGQEVGAKAADMFGGQPTFNVQPGSARTSSSIATSVPLETGGEIPAMPSYATVPPPISADEIVKAFQPYFQAIEAQQGPQPRAVPPPTPALATFLSVLAGSLGSQLTKNPMVQQSIMAQLQDQDQRRQAIQDQNYAEDLVFNQQKANQRLAATGQMLETELQTAIKSNDTDRAMAIQKNLEILRGWIEERQARVKGQEDMRVAVGQEVARAQAKAAEEAKPLDPKGYIDKRNQVLLSKLPEGGGVLGAVGEKLFGKKMTKTDEVARVDKEALQSGNPNTTEIARRNIKQEVLRRVGLRMKDSFSAQETKKIADELEKTWGVSFFEIWPEAAGGG